MNKCVYLEARTFLKYSPTEIIGYLNEKVLNDYQPETPEGSETVPPCVGYQYEGAMPDGGTLMPCSDITSRDEVINGIIRSKYSETEEFSVIRHHGCGDEKYDAEWAEYNNWCEAAKTQADLWMGEKQ